MDEQIDVQRMAIALANAEPIKTEVPAHNAYVLCFLLQFALGHSTFSPGTPAYEIGMLMIEDWKEALTGIDPYLKVLIEGGKNPNNDLSILESGGIQDFN